VVSTGLLNHFFYHLAISRASTVILINLVLSLLDFELTFETFDNLLLSLVVLF
jgi:hypothetical protein